MKILVVDDQEYNRQLLSFILTDEGYDCVAAANGLEACEACKHQKDIGLVLMDITMPEMDGITATNVIKQDLNDQLLPIIFVTALDDVDMLAKCLDAGGDDFVPKPINESVLLAKINAHRRTREIYQNLQAANRQLEYHKQLMDREHSIVERIFNRGAGRIKTDCVNVKKYTSPMSMFNGDIVLEAPSPSGGIYSLVGDFTGHGLAASIGTLPVTEIFYRLASQQASIGILAKEINRSLVGLLPDNMFFCAAITYLDSKAELLSIWAGGMNDMLRFPAAEGGGMQRILSEHMPLGILDENEFDETPKLIGLHQGDRVYVYTDGVNEATNDKEEEFGLERIEKILGEGGESALENLINAVHNFQRGGGRNDDLSILEITAGELVHEDKQTREVVDFAGRHQAAESFPWRFSMRLAKQELRSTSVVEQLMAIVGGVEGIERHREKIFTIVSELYSNALEHGVLGLDSALKGTADGFEQYYRQREQRLSRLDAHFIEVDFLFNKGESNHLVIELTDSGEGFDVQSKMCFQDHDKDAFGRGLPLLQTLCTSLEYFNEGRTVRASLDLSCSRY